MRFDMDKEKVYHEALKKWGANSQIGVAIEELAELIKALCKYPREVNGCSIESIAEEIADVEIMIEQLKIVFSNIEYGQFPQLIEIYKKEKLTRLEKLVKTKQ